PIYLRALGNAFVGADTTWNATGAVGRKASPFNFMLPQLFVWFFLAWTTVVSVWRDTTLGYLNVATVWNVINLLALTAFVVVAAAETRAPRSPRAAPEAEPVAVAEQPTPTTTVEILDRETIADAQEDTHRLLAGQPAPEPAHRTLTVPTADADDGVGSMPAPIRRHPAPTSEEMNP
ncbi:MAG: hypothetical protein ACK5LS_13815, partial [Propioniciclava sp.]